MSVGDDNNKYVFDDGKRPDMPYVAGACFDIKRHKRLPPFDNGKTYKFPELSSLSEPLLPSDILSPAEILKPIDNMMPWRRSPSKPSQVPPKTITERYLRHRPRKTESHDEDKTTRRLEIIRPIRVHYGAYAQVVQCRVDGIRGPLVAKIFDPLYRWQDMQLAGPTSPVGWSESEWSREAAAYERIQEGGLDGRYTPRFEGCWSFDVPWELELQRTNTGAADDTTIIGGHPSDGDEGGHRKESAEGPASSTITLTRSVRLLLLEWIPGDSVSELLHSGAYRGIPTDVRMELLARIAEFNVFLLNINVVHCDLHARNVVVSRHDVHEELDDEERVDNVGATKETRHDLSSSSLPPEENEERPRKRQKLQEPREEDTREWHLKLIDFSRSVVLDLPNAKDSLQGRPTTASSLPINPMTNCHGLWPVDGLRAEPRWTGAAPDEKADWIPEDLHVVRKLRFIVIAFGGVAEGSFL